MTRRTVGLLTFVIGTTLCGLWGYRWLRTVLSWMAQGSGGIGAVSAGLSVLALAVFAVVAPFVITFRLTRLAGSKKLATVARHARRCGSGVGRRCDRWRHILEDGRPLYLPSNTGVLRKRSAGHLDRESRTIRLSPSEWLAIQVHHFRPS